MPKGGNCSENQFPNTGNSSWNQFPLWEYASESIPQVGKNYLNEIPPVEVTKILKRSPDYSTINGAKTPRRRLIFWS